LAKVTVALAIGAEQARNTEQAVIFEDRVVEKLVVDAAVDHVHRFEALDRPHEHPVPVHHQVPPFDQWRPHFPGQEHVLEIGAVVDPG
jgi:hypothetical protein